MEINVFEFIVIIALIAQYQVSKLIAESCWFVSCQSSDPSKGLSALNILFAATVHTGVGKVGLHL